jgi:chromosome segregation ATPase
MTQPVEGAQSGATGGQSAPANDGSTGTDTATSGQSAQQQAADAVSRAEYDQRMAQLAAADRKREEAEQKLKALQDAALSEEEKRKRDLEAATEQIKAKDDEIKGLKLERAFLKDNTHEWHNPDAALKLVDLSNVAISDDGKTTGLKEALEALAKAHPYLVKPKADTTGDGAASTAGQSAGVTGVAGQGGGSGQGNAGRAALEKKFPALKGRTS